MSDAAAHAEIQDSFTERFLWPPDQTELPGTSFQFPDELVQEIQAAASYAFKNAVKNADETLPAQAITFFCPYAACHAVIDSMVKLIARHQSADVLVLDALELAVGEFGAIGEASSVIASMYEEATEGYIQCGPSIRHFFDALLTVRDKTIPESVRPSRRIIYLRDFGSIAPAGKLLLISVLQTMKHLCKGLPPTILVFGIVKEISYDDNDSNSKSLEKWNAAIITGGQALKKLLPSLGYKFPTMTSEKSCTRLHPLSAQFFLPLIYDPFELQNSYLVLSSDMRKEEDELVSCQRGGFIEGRVSDAISECNTNDKSRQIFQTTVLSTCTADLIATTAVGLSNAALSATTMSDSSRLVRMPASQVVKALEIFLVNQQIRREWVDKGKDTKFERLNKEKDEELKPKKDIVKELTNNSDLSKYEERLLSCIVKPELLATTFDDVCIEPEIIDGLRNIISLPLLFPDQFAQGALAKQTGGVLLYGPPGTGKTILCQALAYECGAQMIILKPSDINDKYIGESEKLVSSVFNLARRLSPCVIFIDEADTLFSSRSGKMLKWNCDTLNEFLQEMDGFSSTVKNKRIVVVGATNRPFDIDPAILRRLPRRMMIDLPDRNERESILKIHLKGEILQNDLNLNEIAEMTVNYSGSDLKDLCVVAALDAVKEVIGKPDWASLRKQDENIPAGKDNHRDKPHVEIEDKKKQSPPPVPSTRVIKKGHFKRGFEQVSPSFSEQAQNELYEWHETYSKSIKKWRY